MYCSNKNLDICVAVTHTVYKNFSNILKGVIEKKKKPIELKYEYALKKLLVFLENQKNTHESYLWLFVK